MEILSILSVSLLVFFLAYRFYAAYISKTLGLDNSKQTPAHIHNDGVDYVPTKIGVLFSHHFAAIAGAGPIVGPIIAMGFGYMPVWLWVLLGTVLIGAVQDYTTLFVSMREDGRSMADVAHRAMGKWGFLLFISFTIIMLLLVTSAFLKMTTVSLTSLVSLSDMRISPDETLSLLKTTTVNGIIKVQIGGIASTSVIIMTIFAPLIGWLYYKKHYSVTLVSILAFIVCAVSVLVGVHFPVILHQNIWMILLTIYVVIAAGIPVWIILQPRDMINSFLLYIGMVALLVGVVFGCFGNLSMQLPAWNIAQGTSQLGSIWPFLFITVACGAISGFHALVTGGTVAKQVRTEANTKPLGYGGMLLESILAVLVIVTVCAGLSNATYSEIVFPTVKGVESNPILAFALAMGTMLNNALNLPVAIGTVMGILMVEGFVITTLDTAVRLNRYLFEELWRILMKHPPAILKSYLFNAILSAALMLLMASTNSFKLIWPIFGTANQLLAALSLIVVSVWLAARKKPNMFTLLPAVFMMCTTAYTLFFLLFTNYIPNCKIPLIIAASLLIVLSAGVIILSVRKFCEIYRGKSSEAQA